MTMTRTHPTNNNSWLACCVLLLVLQCYCTPTWAFTPSAATSSFLHRQQQQQYQHQQHHSFLHSNSVRVPQLLHRSLRVSCTGRIIRKAANKDDEIAALEEKLRLLKEDADADTNADVDTNDEESKSTSTSVQEVKEISWKVPQPSTSKRRQQGKDDTTTIAVRKVPVASMDDPFDEMLSEQWKVSKNRAVPKGSSSNTRSNNGGNSGIGGSIKTIVGVVALLLGVVAFSQIPVGQEDLDKYSTAKPSTSIDLG